MTDVTSKTISELEQIVTGYCSDSNKSGQLNNRKKEKSKGIKNKDNESDEVTVAESAKNTTI